MYALYAYRPRVLSSPAQQYSGSADFSIFAVKRDSGKKFLAFSFAVQESTKVDTTSAKLPSMCAIHVRPETAPTICMRQLKPASGCYYYSMYARLTTLPALLLQRRRRFCAAASLLLWPQGPVQLARAQLSAGTVRHRSQKMRRWRWANVQLCGASDDCFSVWCVWRFFNAPTVR